MRFRVRLEDSSGASTTLFEKELVPSAPGMGNWNETVLPLDRYWGQPVKVSLEVFAGENNEHDFGYWANPRFVIDGDS